MKTGKKIVSLLMSAAMFGTSFNWVFAEESISVAAVNLYASSLGKAIENNAEGISPAAGKIVFTLSENIDPDTLSGVTMTSGGEEVICGADLYMAENTAAVKFGMLEPDTEYTIMLNGIENEDNTLQLAPYSFTFTTSGGEDIYNEDFQDFSVEDDREAIKTKMYEEKNFSIRTGDDDVVYTITDAEGDKSLRIKGEGTKGTANGEVTFSESGGIKTGFVLETQVTFEEFNSPGGINIGKIFGESFTGLTRMWKYDKNLHMVYDFSGGSKKVNVPFITNVDSAKEYNIRMVFRIDDTDTERGKAFVVDTYYDKGDGKGYTLVNDGIVTSMLGNVGEPNRRLTSVMPFSINGDTSGSTYSQALVDDMRVYDHLPVQLISSNIKNFSKKMSPETKTLELRFNRDMREDSFEGKISIENLTDAISFPISGVYNASERLFTADIPEGTLEDGKEYEIKIGNVLSDDGFKYDEDSTISFTVKEAQEKMRVAGVTADGKAFADGETGVPADTRVFAVELSDEADAATVTKENVVMTDCEYSAELGEDGKTINIIPEELSGGTKYSISLGEGITSLNGQKILVPWSIEFTTEKSSTEFFVESCSVSDGADNVSVSAGEISFKFDEAADLESIENGIEFIDKAGVAVEHTYSLSADKKELSVKFGTLSLNSEYTVNLKETIKNEAKSKNLAPYTVRFVTEDTNYFLNVDFENDTLYPVGEKPKNTDIDYKLLLNDTVEKEGTYIVTEDEETGNKFLRITSGKGTGSRIYADYDFTKGGTQPGMSESFVFEASVRFSKVGTEFGMGQMTGKLFSDQYRVNPASVGNPSMFIQHYPTPESASTKAEYLIMGINSQKFYNLRFVYSRRTEENRFVIDAYRDDRDGQGYKLINENIRLAKETEKLSDLINTIKIYTINDKPNEEQNAVIDFDNIKIYPYNPPEIVSSSIKDLESGISVDTRDMTFVFNSDINNAVVKSELTDNLTGEKTVLNSEYHADLKSLIVEIPQGALSQNGDYTISLSDVFGIDGMKLEGKNSIRFTTSSSFSPIELSGPITFSAEQGGESLASIYNVSSVFANIPVRKLVAEDVSAVAAVALYDGNGALRKVNFENVLVTEDTVISSAGVEYDKIPYNWYAKAFVWDSLENMAPMLPTGYIKAGVELTVSDMFSDNMVLQRGEKIPVWGTGYDADAVEVSIKDGDEIIAQTEVYPVNSRWKAELPELEAGGPYELTIANGEDTKTFENVSMGDVWLVSGQSNMVKTMNDGLYINDTQTDINNADYPDIRFYKVGELSSAVKADNAGSSWEVCNPATAAKFSCVGFYFGRGVYESLEEGVPVGLIQSAVAGTKIERWISEEGMENYNVTNPVNLSSTLYNGMIAPLQNYNIKGVLWYQGESNYDNAEYYENNLAALIKSWRDEWNKPDMPFIYVQLPPYGQYNFAPIWNAQLNVLKKIENTAMVPAVDLGDLSNIHPAQKDKVGKRAADAAQAVAYGKNIEYMGPLFESAELVNGRVEISFSHAAGLYSETEEIKGFKLGNESVEEDASARIEGNKIILEFNGAFDPEYVSYCYVNEGGVTLFNSAGLPASPFKAEI